jgi:glycosyltransferase involved in cell wall biosynthesis
MRKEATSGEVLRVRKKLDLPRSYILFLGAFEPRKNIVGLIRAYSAIADKIEQNLVLAGCTGWLTEGIERAWVESPAKERIKVLGMVDEADKQALYAGADLFVYPSFYEGFGFPPLEALAAGVPVITSFNSSLPEIVGQWATLIDPCRMDELALVMKEVLKENERVSKEVQDEIEQQYSWEKAARETLALLEEAAGYSYSGS